MKSILDPDFKYTPSHQTDIRKTFKRVRKELSPDPVGSAHNQPVQNATPQVTESASPR